MGVSQGSPPLPEALAARDELKISPSDQGSCAVLGITLLPFPSPCLKGVLGSAAQGGGS